MKKAVVFAALLILVLGVVLAVAIQETRVGEDVIDEWNPISPSVLYPYRNDTENKFNSTGCAFIDRAVANTRANDFKSLLESKNILELFLELNVSASGSVRVRVGTLTFADSTYNPYYYDPKSVKADLVNVIFDESGAYINDRVRIDVNETRANADFLEIKNEGTRPVEISGNIKLIGKMPKPFYPYLGLGTLICLSGFFLMAYGFWAKPKRKITKQSVKVK